MVFYGLPERIEIGRVRRLVVEYTGRSFRSLRRGRCCLPRLLPDCLAG